MVIPCEPVHQDRTKFLIAQSYVNRQRAFKSIQKCTQIINLMPHSKARFTSHSVVGKQLSVTYIQEESVALIIAEKSNFCQVIETADHHLADKGFKIHDLKALRGGSHEFLSRDFLPLTSSQKIFVLRP